MAGFSEDWDWGLQPGSRLGLDIGGTLAKLVFFEAEIKPSWCNGTLTGLVKSIAAQTERSSDKVTTQPSGSGWLARDDALSFFDSKLRGTFHFVTFRSDRPSMEEFVDLLKEHGIHNTVDEIMTTGGGAYKYAGLFRERLGVELRALDELGVVVRGISWLLDRPIQVRDKLNSVDCSSPSDLEVSPRGSAGASACADSNSAISLMSPKSRAMLEMGAKALFPFLLVNIGSGVSVVKVSGLESFERICGSAIGGGTFWGLCKLLCPDCTDFDTAGRLAEEGEISGDASKVNLSVADIYGGDYELPNGSRLPGSTTASFFAKAASTCKAAGGTRGSRPCSDAGLVQALMRMVASNICQIAHLNAKLHGLQRIVFTGNFLRQNSVARKAIADNMVRVSKATPDSEPFKALFLEHEGYFGALGSFLFNVQEDCSEVPRRRSFSQRRISDISHASEHFGGDELDRGHESVAVSTQRQRSDVLCFSGRWVGQVVMQIRGLLGLHALAARGPGG